MDEKEFLEVLSKKEIRARILSFLITIGLVEVREDKILLHNPQQGNIYEEMLFQIFKGSKSNDK